MKFRPTTLVSVTIFSMLGLYANAGDLLVKVEGISAPVGKIFLTLCDDASCFDEPDDEGSFYALIALPVESKYPSFTLPNLPAGDYAAFVFHDANNNGEFDTSFLGRPEEAFGYSNKVLVEADARFKQVKFPVPADGAVTQTIEIVLP